MDEHTIKCNTETRRNKEKFNNIKPIVPIKTPKGKMTRKSPAESSILYGEKFLWLGVPQKTT